MKILFDHQAFSIQKYGGISRYFGELMKHFTAAGMPDFDLALKYSDNIFLDQSKYSGYKLNLPERFKAKSTILSLINQPFSIKKLKLSKYDLFHPTYYDPYFLKYINEHSFVLTVHDMTHELFPEKVHRLDRSAEYKKILSNRAARIICVSENTRNDLCRLLKINETKTEVIYHGSSLRMPSSPSPVELTEKYILYVGTRGYYKNFDALYSALEPLLKEDKELHLVCAGGGRFTKAELLKFEASGLKDKILYKNVNDSLLPHLYSGALVFVFPSLYEGFGIPLIEAFNCDCPVITSHVSSLPEIGGDAVYYIDPHDILAMREAVLKFVTDPDLRNSFILKGRKRKEIFSWEKTAKKTMKLYEAV